MTYRIWREITFPPGLIEAEFSVIMYVKKTKMPVRKRACFITRDVPRRIREIRIDCAFPSTEREENILLASGCLVQHAGRIGKALGQDYI